jgi:hypothetical protein
MKLLFSKKAAKQGIQIKLKTSVRRRLYLLLDSLDPIDDSNVRESEPLLNWVSNRMLSEHGWKELKCYNTEGVLEETKSIEDFIIKGVANYVFDVVEIYYDDYLSYYRTTDVANLEKYVYQLQSEINRILSEADLPWRMIEGSFIKADSKWIENEIMEKAYDLIKAYQFEGALHEIEEARSDLLSGDTKGCIFNSGKAFESVLKTILDKPSAQPRELIRGVMELGIFPEYYNGFLKSFEENILNSVIKIRNKEQGVSHGQGEALNVPPESLAQLALHLTGVLIYYIISRYQEKYPPKLQNECSETLERTIDGNDDVPF